jgi:hypothetical protein
MKWATRELIHFDRIASAWLILRFVDPDATFIYLKKNEFAGDDVNLFGVPGVRLAMHDDQRTTFQRILDAHSISGAALNTLGKIIRDAVNHVIHDASPSEMSKRESLAGGALAFTEGIFLLSATDEECLERCLPLYDALYARLVAQIALEQSAHLSRESVLTQTMSLANATRELRRQKIHFSEVAFADALKLATLSADAN